MVLRVIGVGLGRTGTLSLKLALHRLQLGPCHHMEDVIANAPAQVPLWLSALDGNPDWAAIYDGYQSAADWPTAGFFRELSAVYPTAKFVLTVRSPQSWEASLAEMGRTVGKLAAGKTETPQMRAWRDMSGRAMRRTGLVPGLDAAGRMRAFAAHSEAVRAAIPAERLLVYKVTDSWAPLCAFLALPVPDEPFPHSNMSSRRSRVGRFLKRVFRPGAA